MNNQKTENNKNGDSSLDGKKLESLEADSIIDPDEYEIELDDNISLESLLAELEEEDKSADTASPAKKTAQQEPGARTGTGSLPHPDLVIARGELRRVENEKQELMDLFQRRQADFENFRKRVARERTETSNRITGDVVKKMLPVIDNLQRALEAEATIVSTENAEFQNFFQGIRLISDQLNNVIEGLGVEIIPTVGEPFDPHVHEAVATEFSKDFAPDTVMEELQRGYRIGDTLIRPAMVKVASKE